MSGIRVACPASESPVRNPSRLSGIRVACPECESPVRNSSRLSGIRVACPESGPGSGSATGTPNPSQSAGPRWLREVDEGQAATGGAVCVCVCVCVFGDSQNSQSVSSDIRVTDPSLSESPIRVAYPSHLSESAAAPSAHLPQVDVPLRVRAHPLPAPLPRRRARPTVSRPPRLGGRAGPARRLCRDRRRCLYAGPLCS